VDKKFLEFWGNFLIGVAQGQQHLEDLTRFLQGDFTQAEALTNIFFKAYGLENLKDRDADFQKLWEQSRQEFQVSRRAYLSLLGGVPREDYAELEQRYEELQARATDQEEIIQQLRSLLEGKGLDYGAVTRNFQELIRKQTETVQDFFSGLTELQKKDT
jgi:hypothetical protein